jgi:gliding motility-associated-like protein
MKIKNVLTSIALVFGLISIGTAQMTVSTGVLTPAQYVNNLVGPGIVVSNVTYTGTTQQIGSFGGTSNIGFASGVVLSSGATTELVGPASSQTAGTINVSGISNADLLGVANLAATAVGSGTINSTTDAAILEFDFVPVSNLVSFNFVFSSDEYLTYVNTVFNDVFGFFVSGPGISGPYASPAGFPNGSTNLALVPGTTTPITISTIHPGLNSQYYVNNNGTSHAMNGFTTPIPITFEVICGETYHFKFAVADCQDNFLSTAVFMQDGSFNSPPVNLSLQTANGTDTIPEACVDANLLFIRSSCESNFPLVVDYTVSGTAIDDVDFIIADSPITLAAGQDTAAINIAPIIDALAEGTETIIITVTYLDALGNPQSISGTLYLSDIVPFEINAPDMTVNCYNDSIELAVLASGGSGVYTYDWLASNSDSINDFVSINANGSYDYLVTVTDICLGPLTDTVTVIMNQTIEIDSMWSFPATCDPIGYVAGFYSGLTTGSPNQQPSLTWYGPGQNTSNFINGSVFTDLSSGWYYFTVVDNNIGCTANDSVFVDILNPPIADITATPEFGCSPLTVNFTNDSQNASNFAWDFGNGQTANLGATASQTQVYTTSSVIRLIASEGNCADTAFAFVTISICGCTDPLAVNYNSLANADDGSCVYPSPTVEVPNVFSPNDDGSNELFFLNTTNATNISLTILNRWGNVVFEASGINPAWNGKTQNGNEAGDGVYFYKYRVDGLQEQFLEGHGFLTLVR